MKPILVPYPKNVCIDDGFFHFKTNGFISIDNKDLFKHISTFKKDFFADYEIVIGDHPRSSAVCFKEKSKLGAEAYELMVSVSGATIFYGDLAGAFYGMTTLCQLISASSDVPFMSISDKPDFSIRGYMWDIGRNKIPRLETILDMVDRLASFKVNHLELYMEGAPFPYASHPEMWEGYDVLSGEEIMIIDDYCKERFIDLVPTHNTFGHMGEWLKKLPDDMAMCPGGFFYEPWQMSFPAHSLNPFNPESIKLVRDISDDLLKYFSSSNFNVCCDEVLDLGFGITKGKSQDELAKIFYDFFMQIYSYCEEKGKKMFFWGDMIIHYPQFIETLPKNIMALNWGYEPFEPREENYIAFKNAGIPYCVCPGTATWGAMLGKTAQMQENIHNSIEKGIKYDAEGIILTTWGDNGHLEGWANVFPAILYCSSLSWNFDGNKDMDIAKGLNQFFFKENGAGEFSLKSGTFHRIEKNWYSNQTLTGKLLFSPLGSLELSQIPVLEDGVKHEDLKLVEDLMDECEKDLEGLSFSSLPYPENVKLEYLTGIRAVRLAQFLGHYKLYLKFGDKENQRLYLEKILELLPIVIKGFEDSWIVTNKKARIDLSLTPFIERLEQAKAAYEAL